MNVFSSLMYKSNVSIGIGLSVLLLQVLLFCFLDTSMTPSETWKVTCRVF